MNDYRHQVSGYFDHPAEAYGAMSILIERGIPGARMQLMADGTATVPAPEAAREAGRMGDTRVEATKGHVVLLVETLTAAETGLVRAAIEGAVEHVRDVNLLPAPPVAGRPGPLSGPRRGDHFR